MTKTQDPVPALGLPAGEVEGLRAKIQWAIDTLYEINLNNYELDELTRLNDASVEVALGLQEALRTPVLAPPASAADGDGHDWREDPSADERWNAGLDYGMEQLCAWLGVDRNDVTWDAATETLDGDVQAVLGNILRQKFGDDFDFKSVVPLNADDAPTPGETPGQDAVEALAWALLLHDHPSLPEHHIRMWVAEDLAVARDDPTRRGWGTDFERSQSRARTALASLRSTQADTGGEATTPDLTETELRELLGVEDDDDLDVDEFGGIRTHDGQWQPVILWRFNREEELGLLVIGDLPAPTPLATDGEG